MLTLSEIQDAMQRGILSGDPDILRELHVGARERGERLFEVYRSAYSLRLVEVVRSDHELLATYFGDEMFSDMTRQYLAAHPSHHTNARWVSRHLPEFLGTTEPYASHIEIRDLALIEAALNDAFDAADAPLLSRVDLAGLNLEEWPELLLLPHPSVRTLSVTSNAYEIWIALKGGMTPPVPEATGETRMFVVWRSEWTPRIRQLSSEEARLWNAVIAEKLKFSGFCELFAENYEAEAAPRRAAEVIAGWLDLGFLARRRGGTRATASSSDTRSTSTD